MPEFQILISRLGFLVIPWTLKPFLLNCLVPHPLFGHSVNGWCHVTQLQNCSMHYLPVIISNITSSLDDMLTFRDSSLPYLGPQFLVSHMLIEDCYNLQTMKLGCQDNLCFHPKQASQMSECLSPKLDESILAFRFNKTY